MFDDFMILVIIALILRNVLLKVRDMDYNWHWTYRSTKISRIL